VLIANASNTAGAATVTLLPSRDGVDPVERAINLPASSRTNVQLRELFPTLSTSCGSFGVTIAAGGVPIVVERATYGGQPNLGLPWLTGYASLATPLP
jgi:hypothetical protein